MTIKYRGTKTLVPSRRWDGLGVNRYFSYQDMPYGGSRRRAILQYLLAVREQDHNYIMINRKYCIILRLDKDIQQLLKEGKVKMIKVRQSRKTTYSAIVLPDWERIMINDKVVPVSALLLEFLEEWLEWAKSPDCADTNIFLSEAGLCYCLLRWLDKKRGVPYSAAREHEGQLKLSFMDAGLDPSHPFGVYNYRSRSEYHTQHLDPLRLAWVERTIEVTKKLNAKREA